MNNYIRRANYFVAIASCALWLVGGRSVRAAAPTPCDPRTDYCDCDTSGICSPTADCDTECKSDGFDTTCGDHGGPGAGNCAVYCGDGYCNVAIGEDNSTCPDDCGGSCGDSYCNAAIGEDSETCPEDCACVPNWHFEFIDYVGAREVDTADTGPEPQTWSNDCHLEYNVSYLLWDSNSCEETQYFCDFTTDTFTISIDVPPLWCEDFFEQTPFGIDENNDWNACPYTQVVH